ncbi:hypothetical protein SARC_01023 [Sphaeroforma arctica JP610]|uniref:Uncharacterized protein n=1 Tax=Sphaeroforma arctica JP610 TaxID=667725 RepID=A0A0L0GCU0_9EUKA|nr:hypothetical protein SARC_01023 [Sphaeroforma arctica JP610]KNC86830.1 hypothetical protein SARC_01023 [Sphaeroforma arctica JP610]|eukprot:XP_014160732.1 hypothetical protein SARC_01023 [Sphaeroforma arctica JP610]
MGRSSKTAKRSKFAGKNVEVTKPTIFKKDVAVKGGRSGVQKKKEVLTKVLKGKPKRGSSAADAATNAWTKAAKGFGAKRSTSGNTTDMQE